VNLSLFHIFSRDYDLSFNGSIFIENLIWIEVFENYLSKTSKKKIGIFLLENQAWEKAMITSWKNYNHGKIIGYTPTSINYWHLYNFDISKKKYSSPSKILVSSVEGYRLLKKQYKNKNIELHKVESLWFNYLLNIKNKIISTKNEIVLIVGDYNSKNNYKILNIVSNSNLKKIKKIFFKPHPHDLHNYNIKNITLTNKSNEFFFGKASLIVSPGSTATILEYLFFGKKVFVYDDPFGLDLSPIKHLNYQFKFKSVKDFNRLLDISF
jgi:surface carbohydrate biosynthesis protein (TIGR04326 family)